MTFSIFQVNLPFHAVYPYLKLRPPGASKSPEDWSAAETESLAIGDIVFLLEPIFSSYGNPKQGLGVSEGDSFRVTNMLMLFRQDAGYPMCISLTTDSYEMQFAETILCVKADLAKASGNGFYYLHAAKIPAANEGELAAIAEMHKWGNAGKRLEAPKGLAEPGYFFLNNLKAPVEPIYQKQLFDIEMCAYYLFTDNEQNFKGKAPDLTGFFEPVKRPENALAGIDLEASKPAPAPAPAAPSMSLNSLLSDDWSPTPAPAAPPKVPDVPVPPQPAPSQPPAQAPGKTPPHKLAAEIASLVEGFKKDAEPEPPKGKVSMAPSPGVKHAPPSVPTPPPVNQRGVELKPPNHPLQKPAGPGIGQLINMFGGGKKEEPPKQESPGVAPPPPVPMRGKEGEKTKPAEKLSNDLFTSEYLTTGDSSTGKRIAEESAKIAADEAARKVAEQTAKMLQEQKALEKEEAARKAAEEEAARKAAEEEAARKAAEEEAARKAAEEEAARKAAEEEAARKAAEEEAARKAAEEEAVRKAAEEEAARKAAEEEAARKAAEEEAARKAAEEEATRKAAEEEAARKAAEEEAALKAAEEEAALKAAEEEAKRTAAKSAEEAMLLIAEQAAEAAKSDPAAALLNQQQQIAKLTAEALSALDPFQSIPLPDSVAASALGLKDTPAVPGSDLSVPAVSSTPAFDPFASDAPANIVPSAAASTADASAPASGGPSDFSAPMLGALAAQLQLSAETASPPAVPDNPFASGSPFGQTGPATLASAGSSLPPNSDVPAESSQKIPSLQSLLAPMGSDVASNAPSSPMDNPYAVPGPSPNPSENAQPLQSSIANPFGTSVPASIAVENPFGVPSPSNAAINSSTSAGSIENPFATSTPPASADASAIPSNSSVENPFGASASASGSMENPFAPAPAPSSMESPFAPSTIPPATGSIENPFGVSVPSSSANPVDSPISQSPSLESAITQGLANLFVSTPPSELPAPPAASIIDNPFDTTSVPTSEIPPATVLGNPFGTPTEQPAPAAPIVQDPSTPSSSFDPFPTTPSLPGNAPPSASLDQSPSVEAPASPPSDVPALASDPLAASPTADLSASPVTTEAAMENPLAAPVVPASAQSAAAPDVQPAGNAGIANPFGNTSVPVNSPLTPPPVTPLVPPQSASIPPVTPTVPPPAPSLPPVVPASSPVPSLSTSGSFMAATTSGALMGHEPASAAVGGLVAKLEQQAQRANAKLEQKLDEIQGRLQRDLTLTISKLAVKEQASLRNILSLKTVLSRRLAGTSEELKEQVGESVGTAFDTISSVSNSGATEIENLSSTLSVEVLQQFDELSTNILGLAGGFADKCQGQHEQGLASLQEVLLLMHSRLEEVGRQHAVVLQKSYEQLEVRANELSLHSDSELSSTYERLKAELASYRQESLNRLDTLSSHLLEAINESIALSLLNIQIHAEIRGSNVLLPRLLNYKQSLSIKAEQLREKYKEEVEKLAVQKLAELKPLIAEQREQMEKAAKDARQLKSTVEVGQREEFEKMYAALSKFVDEKIVEARGMSGFSADELGKIERSVSQLSDAATIESDAELAQARKQVLTKLQSIGVQLQTNVNDSLRGQISAMEDKGRMLQEELISSMEGNAYAVRKSSEASISRVRQALEIAYQQISELQNHYLQ